MNEHICKIDTLEDTAAKALLDSLPASLLKQLDQAIAAGASKDDILDRIAAHTGNRKSLTVLAIEEYLNQRGPGGQGREE